MRKRLTSSLPPSTKLAILQRRTSWVRFLFHYPQVKLIDNIHERIMKSMDSLLELFISKTECFFGKHILDFENDTEVHCYCRKKYVRKPVPKMQKAVKKQFKQVVKKKVYLPKCPITGKLSRTEHRAKEKAKNEGLRAYRCAFCPHWHLTHKADKMRLH
jgi:hypothetical protein